MDWQTFTETGKSFRPKLSLWSGGQVAFNKGACHRFGVKEHDYAVLMYCAAPQAIGVRLVDDPTQPGAMAINKRGTGAAVSGKSFIDYYGLREYLGRDFDLELDRESGVLVAELK